MGTTGSEHKHKHSSNPILPHYSLGCIIDTYRRLSALWDRRQHTQHSPDHSYLSTQQINTRSTLKALVKALYTVSPALTGLYCRKWTTNKSSSSASSGEIQNPAVHQTYQVAIPTAVKSNIKRSRFGLKIHLYLSCLFHRNASLTVCSLLHFDRRHTLMIRTCHLNRIFN